MFGAAADSGVPDGGVGPLEMLFPSACKFENGIPGDCQGVWLRFSLYPGVHPKSDAIATITNGALRVGYGCQGDVTADGIRGFCGGNQYLLTFQSFARSALDEQRFCEDGPDAILFVSISGRDVLLAEGGDVFRGMVDESGGVLTVPAQQGILGTTGSFNAARDAITFSFGGKPRTASKSACAKVLPLEAGCQ